MELLDPFKYVSYDKMIEICESLDNESLNNLVKTSKTAHRTCQWILDIREQEYQDQINSLANLIKTQIVLIFTKKVGTATSVIEVSSRFNPTGKLFRIDQQVTGENKEEVRNFPWPLPNVSRITYPIKKVSGVVIQTRNSLRIDKDSFARVLAKTLIDQEYTLHSSG